MGMIVISLGTPRSAGGNFEWTTNCLGMPATSLRAPGTSLAAPRIMVEQSGKNIFFGNATAVPGMLQVRLECCRCAWNAAGAPGMLQVRLERCSCARDAAGAPGMLQVRLEIIATIYHATIVKIHVLRLYSHLFIYVSMNLCVYIVTHLHAIYLDRLQVVLESNSRCA